MSLMLSVLTFLAILLGAGIFVASRCPLVRIVARLFSAQAERHRQAAFHI